MDGAAPPIFVGLQDNDTTDIGPIAPRRSSFTLPSNAAPFIPSTMAGGAVLSSTASNGTAQGPLGVGAPLGVTHLQPGLALDQIYMLQTVQSDGSTMSIPVRLMRTSNDPNAPLVAVSLQPQVTQQPGVATSYTHSVSQMAQHASSGWGAPHALQTDAMAMQGSATSTMASGPHTSPFLPATAPAGFEGASLPGLAPGAAYNHDVPTGYSGMAAQTFSTQHQTHGHSAATDSVSTSLLKALPSPQVSSGPGTSSYSGRSPDHPHGLHHPDPSVSDGFRSLLEDSSQHLSSGHLLSPTAARHGGTSGGMGQLEAQGLSSGFGAPTSMGFSDSIGSGSLGAIGRSGSSPLPGMFDLPGFDELPHMGGSGISGVGALRGESQTGSEEGGHGHGEGQGQGQHPSDEPGSQRFGLNLEQQLESLLGSIPGLLGGDDH